MTTQGFTELYEQLRNAALACGFAGSTLLRRAVGILSVNGVLGLIEHFEELHRLLPTECDPDSLPERRASRASVSEELVHILTDVALAVASTEIRQ